MKITPPFVRSPGNYDPVAACEECCVDDWGPTKTHQSMAEDADINTIMRRFGQTGRLPDDLRTPTYADYDQVLDYHSAMNAVADANSQFMKLPPAIRARFDNDPGKFLDYASDPENIDGLRDMGLAKAKEEATSTPTGPTPGGEPRKPPGPPSGSGQGTEPTKVTP